MKCILNKWALIDVESGDRIQANVPGDITTDLLRVGKIEDPYFGLNHHDCYELCRKD